jgi:glycerol-3-phosphate dehydrogenase
VGRLTQIQKEAFDVAIVGGGIVGCGIARDAASRGLRVVLVEKSDFGGGTTSASTRIVHGGLRYLEMLDLRLVRLDLRERETLLRIAPHLVRPLEFLIPFFRGDVASALKMRLGLAVYDALSFDKNLPSRRWVTAAEARQMDPILKLTELSGVAAYHDARIDSPERLAVENIVDAEAHGGVALNYCEAVAAVHIHGRVAGIRVRDRLNGDEAVLASRVLVNATGAWFDHVNQLLSSRPSTAIRMTKGIHIVCRPVTSKAIVLFSQVDRRLMFAIPRRGLTWIGTTDTDFHGDPSDARTSRQDVDYVVASVKRLFPGLSVGDVLYTTAGVRALVRRSGSASSVTRMHRVVDGPPIACEGVISILGGKITGYRAIAQEATDMVCRKVGAADRRSRTAETLLPGARGRRDATSRRTDAPSFNHLFDLYGTRADEVASIAQSDPSLAMPLNAAYQDIGAQVVHAVRHEHARRVADFLRRRSLLGASADQGLAAAEAVARLMANQLGWSESEITRQVREYADDVTSTEVFRGE